MTQTIENPKNARKIGLLQSELPASVDALAVMESLFLRSHIGGDEMHTDHRFLLDSDLEIFAVRLAEMFKDGSPVKWGPARYVETWGLVDDESMADYADPVPVDKAAFVAEAGNDSFPLGSGLGALDAVYNTGFQTIHRADIRPWSGQPRKHFPKESISALAGMMKARGFDAAFPLLVRPATTGSGFEIADGECRWRAATEAGLDELPCVVRSMSDVEMFELAMISSIHKRELSPMEEALGLARMLEFRDENGKPLHTRESISKTLNIPPTTLGEKIALVRLANSPVGEALDDGKITAEHARHIARIPTAETRERVLQMVLKPSGCGSPMPVADLRARLALEFMRDLRGVEWELDDALLVPVMLERGERVGGGACSDCPFNQVAPEAKRKNGMCMSPECFRSKERAIHARWVAAKKAAGKEALEHEENSRAFAADGVKLAFNSPFVDLDEVPTTAELGQTYGPPLPPWGRLVDGSVPVVLARDGKGRERALVDRKLAVAAVERADAAKPEATRILAPKRKELATATPEEIAAAAKAAEKQKAEREKEDRIFEAQRKAVVEASRKPLAKVDFGWLSLVKDAVARLLDDVRLLDGFVKGKGWKEKMTPFQTFDAATKDMAEHFVVELVTEMLMLVEPDELDLWGAAAGIGPAEMKKTREATIAAMKAEKAAAQEEAKAAELITWPAWKSEVDDFEWNEAGVCTNANTSQLELKKSKATVKVARCAKGWVFGYSVDVGTTGKSSPCAANGTAYDAAQLAISAALKGVKKTLEAAGDEAGAAAVAKYLAKAKKGAK